MDGSKRRQPPKQAKRRAGCGQIKSKKVRSLELSNGTRSAVEELVTDRLVKQLIKHKCALGRSQRATNEAIQAIDAGDDPIKATQRAIEATECLWHHNETSTPKINNGALMKCLFDLLGERS